MERSTILRTLNEIFCSVLNVDEVTLTDDSKADDIEEWDSLTHVQLVYTIQKSFGIKFTSLEILKWKNVGEMIDSIMEKID